MSRIRPLQRRSAPPQDQRQDSFRVAGEAVPDRFLSELGARVRTMRAVRGMSRKVLAQTSGVSERYIAQLESGQGNVSIMMLRRLAEVAADQRVLLSRIAPPLPDMRMRQPQLDQWQVGRRHRAEMIAAGHAQPPIVSIVTLRLV